MGQPTTWHEDDAFWQAAGPLLFSAKRWERAPHEVDLMLALLTPVPAARVLDLCCGPGRHALEWARRGFAVVGVDRTPRYLDDARARAAADGMVVEFVREDMRRFCRPEAFDIALNLWTSFGYFEDQAEDRQVLLNLYRSLRAGGQLLMELMSKEVLAAHYRERDWQEEGGRILLEERKITRDWSWCQTRWIVLADDRRHETAFANRLYAASELMALLKHCGFADVTAFGSLAGTPYDPSAQRLIVRARK